MIIHLDRLQPRQTCKRGAGPGVEEKEPSEFLHTNPDSKKPWEGQQPVQHTPTLPSPNALTDPEDVTPREAGM